SCLVTALPLVPRQQTSTLFPYTTLFRSEVEEIPPALLKGQVERAVPFELKPIPALEQGGDQRVLARLQRDFESGPRSSALVNGLDRKSTRLNSSHVQISYAVFCLKKKKK